MKYVLLKTKQNKTNNIVWVSKTGKKNCFVNQGQQNHTPWRSESGNSFFIFRGDQCQLKDTPQSPSLRRVIR